MENWFGTHITGWYLKNKRDLPWRQEKDAYKIWLSEIILQQTQVVQGLNYYLKFTQKYPTVKDLAMAPEDEVLRLWQGLGYYSRARNLHASAKLIHANFKGIFPSSYSQIKELKGVGDYTASAIASFAYDLPHAVVDGNVYRVLSRVFGIKTPIDASKAKKEFQELADQLLDKKNPARYNQAIMEFGSQYCKPSNPDCESCVLNDKCYAFKHGLVAELPIKAKKVKIRKRHFNYLVPIDKKGNLVIHKRQAGDIWQGLYEFTLIETDTALTQQQLFKTKQFKEGLKSTFTVKYTSVEYKHILSHQHLYAKFYVLMISEVFKKSSIKTGSGSSILTNIDKLNDFAFPRLTGKFLDDCDLKEIV
ncbi:A/G-specific adenine glycosylase [Sphingobacteriaceae bacterium]|nr:A/G-specific adenine glycosylase [Sphingobacteriaceae bacterium]